MVRLQDPIAWVSFTLGAVALAVALLTAPPHRDEAAGTKLGIGESRSIAGERP